LGISCGHEGSTLKTGAAGLDAACSADDLVKSSPQIVRVLNIATENDEGRIIRVGCRIRAL
jgi:hypothetical protein